MPTYIYTAPSGRKVRVTSDTPPTPEQLQTIFANAGVLESPPQPAAPAAPQTWSDRLGLNEPTASPAVGFLRGSGAAAVDMLEGGASGLANTVFQGGDLVRRALGMDRVIDTPEAQRAMTAPPTVPGQIGRFVEQGAEFAYPLSKISKGAAALSWVPRMAVEGAASAGTAGVQTGGDPGAMAVGALAPAVGSAAWNAGKTAVNAARTAAAGAVDDGVRGAVGALVRRAAPVDAKGAIIQAIKPRNSLTNFARNLDLSLPEVKAAEQRLRRPVQSVDDLLEATKLAKRAVREQYDAIAGPRRAMRAQVDLAPVADAIERSIPRKVQIQNPEQADRIRALAETYRTNRFSLEDAEQILRETNDELEAYYNKFPQARGKAMSNPETAQTVAEAEALRKAIYDSFSDGSDSARQLQRRYGALMELEDSAYRRSNVAKRQQPESLSEQIGKVRAAADMARGTWRVLHGDFSGAADIAAARAGTATAGYLKEQQTTDALIRRAFEAYDGRPVPVSMPQAPRIAGELPPANIRLGSAPDASYVRAVPGEFATPEPRPGQRALPPARPDAIPMPPGPDPSGVQAVPAARSVQRDPRTGRMRRVYSSDAGKK